MTRLTKKVLTWFLSAFAFIALALGVAFSMPAQKASAETLATENWTLVIESSINSFRIQNGNAYWTTYTNYVTTESMLDYTEINGKTLSEINAENPGAITVTLQPVLNKQGNVDFSFYRVTIDPEMVDLTLSDLGTVVMREGWSHTDANATYTIDTDLYFAHTQNTSAIDANNWKYIPKENVVDVSDDITMQDQGVQTPNSRTILVQTGKNYWGGSPITPNEAGGAFLNMLYINGTSIQEWNKKAVAMLDKGEISDITFGCPQGNIQNGAPYAPIYTVNSNPGGGYGSIFQTWIPTGYIDRTSSFKVGKGFANLQGDTLYYVGKDVEYVKSGNSFVKVASSEDITDTLKFYDGGSSSDKTTNYYYIYTEGGQKWTAAYGNTNETALGEFEWKEQSDTTKQGGSVQMSYIYINGQSAYDINATDNGAYGSTHGNISTTAKFAPIMPWVVPYNKDLNGSAISIQMPSAYPGNKTTIAIKKGFYIVDTSTNIKYEVTRDLQWDYKNGAWDVHMNGIAASVDDIKIFGGASDAFAGISLVGDDYAAAPGTYAGGKKTALSFAQRANFKNYVLIDDQPLATPGEAFLNVWGNYGYFTFRPGKNTATKITVLAGCQIPTYKALFTGINEVYVTTEDVTFVKDASGNWVKDESVKSYTVTVDGVAQTVVNGECAVKPANPTKAEDENYTYTFDNWYIVGTDTVFDFATEITKDYNVESRFTAHAKANSVPVSFTAILDREKHETYGTSIRFNTEGLQWTTSHNWVSAADWKSIADYTYINGKSVTEINAGITEGQKLTLMMQPATTFSFLRVYIPETVMSIDDITTMGIKAGWSFNNGTAEYVVSQAYDFYIDEGTMRPLTSDLKANDVTISDMYVGGEAGELYKVDITSEKWTISLAEYDYNYFSAWQKQIRKNIFINGTSLYEINTTVDDSSYTYSTFPMTNGDDTFGNPTIIHSPTGGHTLTIWIHKNYIESLGAGDITITLGVGLFVITGSGIALCEEKSAVVGGTYLVTAKNYDGTVLDVQTIVKGGKATAIANPSRPMTSTGIYTFAGWKDGEGNDFDFATTPITGDITVIAQYSKEDVSIHETKVLSIQFQHNSPTDSWLIFELSNHDYGDVARKSDTAAYHVSIAELQRIGLLDNIVLYGTLNVGGQIVNKATIAEIGLKRTALIAYWRGGVIGLQLNNMTNYDMITKIVVKGAAFFPSYEYACNGKTSVDVRYMVYTETVFEAGTPIESKDAEGNGLNKWTTPFGSSDTGYEIFMADGAAIRLSGLDNYNGEEDWMATEGYKNSGIRFQTMISKNSITEIQGLLGGVYESVSFGTLIVPSADIMGGNFSHEWLEANGVLYMDIKSTAWLTATDYAFAIETDEYVSFFGSIVKLHSENHSRYFSGVGYMKVVDAKGEESYFYAPVNQSCSRSASYIAQAAVADRNDVQTDNYDNEIEMGSWSPYTAGEIVFLKLYMGSLANTEVEVQEFTLTSTGKFGWGTDRNMGTLTVNKALNAAYIILNYQTNIDVWGRFYYQNSAGTKSAVEDFYLPKGSSQHKQFFDLFRKNGVGTLAGITADDLYLTKIEFQNATVDTSSSGTFKFLGLYTSDKKIDTSKLEVYYTRKLDKGGEMTVGAHLGLGGALTYLAKSGLYEGVTSSTYNKASVLLRQNTSEFVETRKTNWLGLVTEKGWYGHATSSKPEDGAVNLINNFDAGRQVQQSWYANVGTDTAGVEANGYTRLFCTTDNRVWPYNPVQAGDIVSNPGQIIDYEVNETEGYIYVKARAMDWAYGDKSNGGRDGGLTTKSYMENYYRLNADGTLYVNNSFVDWNGFTDMASCDFCSVELPAFYPIQSLNTFVTYAGASPWTNGALTYRSDLSGWTGNGNKYFQSNTNSSANGTLGEEWVAWANDASGSVAFGMYIPNVDRFTSGRSQTSISTGTTANVNAKSNELKSKGLMSNMQAINYTYQGAYVQNTSYTAPGISFRMAAYVPIEYTYVLAVNDINTVRSQFKAIHDTGKVTNAGMKQGDKVGLDAWARDDKIWTQF